MYIPTGVVQRAPVDLGAGEALELTVFVDGYLVEVLLNNRDLCEPLELCYHSLHACGMGMIADGDLLDTLRRAAAFGLFLVRLDVRQDSSRHVAALAEITDYLGIGQYDQWDEQQRLDFLQQELNNQAPCRGTINNRGQKIKTSPYLSTNTNDNAYHLH